MFHLLFFFLPLPSTRATKRNKSVEEITLLLRPQASNGRQGKRWLHKERGREITMVGQ